MIDRLMMSKRYIVIYSYILVILVILVIFKSYLYLYYLLLLLLLLLFMLFMLFMLFQGCPEDRLDSQDRHFDLGSDLEMCFQI